MKAAPASVVSRFWSKVDRSRGSDECWAWTASVNSRGYGRIRIDGATRLAHRVSWELAHGPIPGGSGFHGMCVLHRCDNRLCVNPTHLFLGTNRDNVLDMHHKRRNNQPKGERVHNSVLTDETVMEIRELYSTGQYSTVELGQKFGVGHPVVSRVVRGEAWSHLPTMRVPTRWEVRRNMQKREAK